MVKPCRTAIDGAHEDHERAASPWTGFESRTVHMRKYYRTKEAADAALVAFKKQNQEHYSSIGERFSDNSFVACTKTCLSPKDMAPEWYIMRCVWAESSLKAFDDWKPLDYDAEIPE